MISNKTICKKLLENYHIGFGILLYKSGEKEVSEAQIIIKNKKIYSAFMGRWI